MAQNDPTSFFKLNNEDMRRYELQLFPPGDSNSNPLRTLLLDHPDYLRLSDLCSQGRIEASQLDDGSWQLTIAPAEIIALLSRPAPAPASAYQAFLPGFSDSEIQAAMGLDFTPRLAGLEERSHPARLCIRQAHISLAD